MEQHLSSMEMFLRSIWQLKLGGKGKWKSPSKCKKRHSACIPRCHVPVRSSNREQIYHWQTANLSAAETCTVKPVLKTVLRTCKRNALLCVSTEQPLKSLAAFEITALTTRELCMQLFIQNILLFGISFCCYLCVFFIHVRMETASAKNIRKNVIFTYLLGNSVWALAWLSWIPAWGITAPDPKQHNLRCWSFNAWIPWRGDGVTVCSIAQETTQCPSTMLGNRANCSGRFSLFFPSHVSTRRCGP